MFRNDIKSRIKVSFLFIPLIVLVLSLVNMNFISNISIIEQKQSFYQNSNIDFDIPSPSYNQLEDISKNSLVKNVFGYHFAYVNLTDKNSNQKNITLIMSDYIDNLAFTGFGDENVISKVDNDHTNFIYLDYVAASILGKKINDMISFDFINVSYKITKILNTIDYFPGGVLFLPYENTIKTYYDEYVINEAYSGAFIEANNVDEFNSYLIDYKPLGRLFPRESFSTEQEYQIHLNSWNNTSFYNEITRFSSFEITERNYLPLAFSTFSTLLTFFLFQLFFFNKVEKPFFEKMDDSINLIKSYYKKLSIFEFLLFLILSILVLIISISTIGLYFPISLVNPVIFSYVFISILILSTNSIFFRRALKITL